MPAVIPERVIGRLSLYRRLLTDYLPQEQDHIFSHQLATHAQVSPAQVRRDLMLTNYSGNPSSGYKVQDLVAAIERIMDPPGGVNVGLVGIGHLGSAILTYFRSRCPSLHLVAGFDLEPTKVDKLYTGIPCFHINELEKVIREKRILVGVVTVPGDAAQAVADIMVENGIRGILNFAPTPLRVPPGVFLEEICLTMSLEKVAYYALATSRTRGKE